MFFSLTRHILTRRNRFSNTVIRMLKYVDASLCTDGLSLDLVPPFYLKVYLIFLCTGILLRMDVTMHGFG